MLNKETSLVFHTISPEVPTLTLSGVEVTNFTGQTYQNTTSPFVLTSGTNAESTSGNVVSSQNYTYANIDGTSTMLDGVFSNTGVGGAYALKI